MFRFIIELVKCKLKDHPTLARLSDPNYLSNTFKLKDSLLVILLILSSYFILKFRLGFCIQDSEKNIDIFKSVNFLKYLLL